jgi:hypothetical protein
VVQSIFMALDWNESFLFLAVGCQKDSIPELLFRLLKQRDFVCVCLPFFRLYPRTVGCLKQDNMRVPWKLGKGGRANHFIFPWEMIDKSFLWSSHLIIRAD